MTQFEIAQKILCGQHVKSKQLLNMPYALDRAFAYFNFQVHKIKAPLAVHDLVTLLERKQPVFIRIIKDKVYEHYVVITGADNSLGEQQLFIADPAAGEYTVLYKELISGSHNTLWTTTILIL